MDSSGSIVRNDYDRAKDFMKRVINLLDVERGFARVAFVVFSTKTTVIFRLNRYDDRRDMVAAIGS